MNIFKLIIIRALIYFFYSEIQLFIRKIKYLIVFNKKLNLFKYLKTKEKNYLILRDKIKKRALEKNFIFWKKFIEKNEISKNDTKDKILITSLVSTKIYTIYNNIVGLYLSKKLKNNFVGLIKHDDFETEIFMKFWNKKILYLDDGNFFTRFKYFLLSIKMINKIFTTDDFLNLKHEGVFVGKSVYDHYIRFTGIASSENIDPKFYLFLSKTLRIHNDYKKILKLNSFKNIIQSETQFIPSCIIFQNSLLNKSTVYTRIGGASNNQISVRIYDDINHIYKNRYRFSSKLFNFIFEKFRHLALDKSKL